MQAGPGTDDDFNEQQYIDEYERRYDEQYGLFNEHVDNHRPDNIHDDRCRYCRADDADRNRDLSSRATP